MQYCTKCRNLTEDKFTVCPHCKRTRGLRTARDGDMVFFMKTTEYEAGELGNLFGEHGVSYTAEPFSTGLVSSLYDSQVMPTDKNLYVALESLDNAKQLLSREQEAQPPALEPEPPTGKRLAIQIASIVAFLALVAIVAMSADWVFEAIKNLFSGG